MFGLKFSRFLGMDHIETPEELALHSAEEEARKAKADLSAAVHALGCAQQKLDAIANAVQANVPVIEKKMDNARAVMHEVATKMERMHRATRS